MSLSLPCGFFLNALASASKVASIPLLPVIVEASLDVAGVAIAIWTLWTCLGLPIGGHLRRAFGLISVGGLAFALSHVLDTILQLLGVDAAILIHQGTVLLALLCFLPGLAALTDALPPLQRAGRATAQLQPWPLVVGLIFISSAISFILYGVSALAEVATFLVLDSGILILTGIALALVVRARLGGPIGRALWLALVGLLLFSLAHPLQAWLYQIAEEATPILNIIHRLIVMPAFLLFASSLATVARSLSTTFLHEKAFPAGQRTEEGSAG
jgi:hypothetical protein